MKNLITASACVALLMAFLVQFVHLQIIYQQIVMTNHVVDLYQEREDKEWLQNEVSRIMGCSRMEVEIDDVDEGYQVSFPLPNYIASPKFWGIEDENENENAHRIYVIERENHEAED